MTASDAALVIATIASPIVAIVGAVIGYRVAVRTATIAKTTADADRESERAAADADRELERQRLSAESSREQTNWYLQQRREAYVQVLSYLVGLQRRMIPSEDKPGELREFEVGIADALPALNLFAAEGVPERLSNMLEKVKLYRDLYESGQIDLFVEAPYVLGGLATELIDLMRNTMGTDPTAL
ncbi:hypothetical protein ACFQ58_02615 [Agromyces sp. NPDC056523]|uniref:hypothetical protein n=1 Tax=Agromyces sp. NPDC056523 TaxID=3345850 RepID=UPI00366D09F1